VGAPRRGHSHLLGLDELAVNGVGFVPVSHRAWLEAREPGEVLLVDGAAVGDPDALWGGLARLHALVLRATALVEARATAAERDRVARRAAADRRALQGACARLAGTLDPRAGVGAQAALASVARAGERQVPGYEDALLVACRIAGEAAGVAVKGYVRGEGIAPPRDPLAAIARASRVRTRQVALRGAWWERDHGPLVARVAAPDGAPDAAPNDPPGAAPGGALAGGPTPRPVALVPTGRARGPRYTVHDPLAGRAVPLGAAEAAALEPFAHALYRPFPARVLSVADVARFGLRGCGRDLTLVAGMGLAGALLGLVPPMATGVLFNTVIPGAQRPQLVQLAVVLVVCALATAMFNFTRAVALLRVEGRMGAAVQAAVWDRLLALPTPFFRPYSAGDLAVRAMGVDAIRQVVSGATISAVLGGVFSLVNFALMFKYSARLAWYATLLIALAVAVAALGSWLQLRHQRGVAAVQARVSGLVLQLLSGVAKLRVAGAEARAFTRWAERFGEQRRLQFRAERVANAVAAVQGAFPTAANLVLFWAALQLLGAQNAAAEGGRLTTGDFLAFLSAYASCQGALLGTCTALLATLTAVPLYEQARPILATAPEVDEGKTDPGVLGGAVELRNVHFRYAADGPPTLRDVSLSIAPGEFVAFVGPSGSGKSTLLRLLLGFERPESGAVYYDGQDLAGLDVQAVRRQIGVVLQNGQLMSGDIFTNIAGSAPVSLDDAWEAARMAGFDADVRAMPMGMHTVVAEGAGTLSGGQRQRLMIARAIVQRPRMLYFDEATSALDNRTQATVTESLDRLRATRIVVAHRLSTVVNADRIVVVERGQVVQVGRYDELMAQPGLFAELARRQIA
jgi:ATP-binding cassette subfamily C protein